MTLLNVTMKSTLFKAKKSLSRLLLTIIAFLDKICYNIIKAIKTFRLCFWRCDMDKLDILNREEFVEKLFNLTQQLSSNNKKATFAIDGSWGVGKSFVLDMYEEKLSQEQLEETNKNRYFVIRYNCWKYDYYEEPLIAIVSAMIETIEQKTKLFPNNEKKSKILGGLKAVGLSLLSMANSAIREKTGIDLKKAYDTVKDGVVAEAKEYEEKHDYDVYFGFNKAMVALQQSLAELSNEYTVVFMVDELDRCLPEYAIKVLERLHHLTESAKNTITVVAIDKTQLVQSIKNTFGFDECDKYLKKFIEFEIELNYGMISEKFVEKHSEYVALFDKSIIEYEDPIEEFMQAVFQKIEVREQEQLVNRAMLVHKLLFNELKDYSFMCVEVLSIVLLTHYEDRKNFTEWFTQFFRSRESTKDWPPFDYYFNTKFSDVPITQIVQVGYSSGEIHRITHEKTMYGAIAYVWYSLYMRENSTPRLDIEDEKLKNLLDSNINDLKKFIDTIKFIK